MRISPDSVNGSNSEIDRHETGITRDQLQKILWAENVLARRYFYPGCHRLEPYRSDFSHVGLLLPETELLCDRVLVLPNDTSVSVEDVSAICRTIRLTLENAAEVTSLLAQRSADVIAAAVSA